MIGVHIVLIMSSVSIGLVSSGRASLDGGNGDEGCEDSAECTANLIFAGGGPDIARMRIDDVDEAAARPPERGPDKADDAAEPTSTGATAAEGTGG